MFKLKYQLSPNGPYVGGGKEVGESSGESSDISTSGGVTRGLIDYTTEDGEIASVSVAYDADGNIIPNTINNNAKAIGNLYISKLDKFIKPKGDKRKIRVMGTPGAIFSLTIKDSADCSILEDEIENVEIPQSGKYEFNQVFPSILTSEGASKTKETYSIHLTPAADVALGGTVSRENPTKQVHQYADPVVTVTNSFTPATIGGNIQVAGADVTKTGLANKLSDDIPGYEKTTYTLAITESSAADGFFYLKDKSFNNNVSTSTTIKKVVSRGTETGLTKQLNLKPLTTRIETSIEGDDFITGNVANGMNIYAKIEKTKTVEASLDKNGDKIDYGTCLTPTDKLELHDTNDLVEGMIVSGDGIIDTSIKSIDCNKRITLSSRNVVKKKTKLTFKKEYNTTVINVISQVDSEGNACVEIGKPIDIPNNTEVELDDNRNILHGKLAYSGSGTDSLTLTTTVHVRKFGFKNVTYTLDLDNMITRKPNAYDQEVTIKKNSSGYKISMIRGDNDDNASSKTGTVVTPASHGTVSSYTTGGDDPDTFTYTPNNGFRGEDFFTFTMSDGETASEEKTVRITVK